MFSYSLPIAGCMMVGEPTHLSEPVLSVFKVELYLFTGGVRFGCSHVWDAVAHARLQQALGL